MYISTQELGIFYDNAKKLSLEECLQKLAEPTLTEKIKKGIYTETFLILNLRKGYITIPIDSQLNNWNEVLTYWIGTNKSMGNADVLVNTEKLGNNLLGYYSPFGFSPKKGFVEEIAVESNNIVFLNILFNLQEPQIKIEFEFQEEIFRTTPILIASFYERTNLKTYRTSNI
jgi:hypothetical protein